jgi:hypothetical protein
VRNKFNDKFNLNLLLNLTVLNKFNNLLNLLLNLFKVFQISKEKVQNLLSIENNSRSKEYNFEKR